MEMSGAGADWHDVQDIPTMDLLTAAYHEQIDKVEELIRTGTVNVNACDDDGVTALQIAAFVGNSKLVELLIRLQADIEARNQVGMTPFLHSCREGKSAIMYILLRSGADKHAVTKMGATALSLAAAGGHMEIVKMLVGLQLPLTKPPGLCPTPLIAAAFKGNPQICGFLTHKGALIDETIEGLHNLSALSCVLVCPPAPSYSTVILSALLDLGADPMKKTLRRTAAELARVHGRKDALQILEDKDRNKARPAEPDIRQLIQEGQLDSYNFYQKKEIAFNDGSTALMFACMIGEMPAVRRLLDNGQDILAEEPRYRLSALQISALFRFDDAVNMLISLGAPSSRLNDLQLSTLDMYLTGTEDPDSAQLEKLLSCFRGSTEGRFSLSSSGGAMKALQNVFLEKMKVKPNWTFPLAISAERTAEPQPIQMKHWRDNRLATWSTDGRNKQKLVRVDEILKRSRCVVPRRSANSLEKFCQATRDLALEARSFAVETFYDYYTKKNEDENEQFEETRECSDYDIAMYYSKQYGYQQRRKVNLRDSMTMHRRDSSDSERRKNRTTSSFLESPQQRQTPRMLKKSRESMAPEERCESPSIRAHAHDLLRKTTSTPQLVQVPTVLNVPHSHASFLARRQISDQMLWTELKKRGLMRYIDLFHREEIGAEVFLQLNNSDLIKIGISSSIDRSLILDVRTHLSKMASVSIQY